MNITQSQYNQWQSEIAPVPCMNENLIFEIRKGIWLRKTGAVDRYGIEIIEGDIIKICDVIIYAIEFSLKENKCISILIDKPSNIHLSDVSDNNVLDKIMRYHARRPDIEIIGNIVDNPELIEKYRK